jgi:hypothetical protein
MINRFIIDRSVKRLFIVVFVAFLFVVAASSQSYNRSTGVSPTFTATLPNAGYIYYGAGSDNCVARQPANSDCEEANGTVSTSFHRVRVGTPSTGFPFWTYASPTMTESIKNTIPVTSDANGIHNFGQASQSQTTVAGTKYYVTNSNLNMPAVYSTAIASGTTMRWRVAMTKSSAGTGTFIIYIFMGTNGTVSDTAEVSQSIGTQTAAIDDLTADVTVTFTSTSAFYWSLVPRQTAATATGFGITYPATAAYFSGTVTGLTTTTASLIFGIGFSSTTGTPTVVVPMVQAEALGVN